MQKTFVFNTDALSSFFVFGAQSVLVFFYSRCNYFNYDLRKAIAVITVTTDVWRVNEAQLIRQNV